MNQRALRGLLAAGWCVVSASLGLAAEAGYLYPQSPAFVHEMKRMQARGIEFTDWHIHIRGGMTPQKASERQLINGIASGVLDNYGREWELSDSTKVAAFIDACQTVIRNEGKPLLVGIQVNDRDWFERIDPAVLKRLDYVLADPLIMGVNADGKPCRLFVPGLVIDDAEAWMEKYVAHHLQILDEPISILAVPTYLPACLADRYDELWTEARMRKIIAKAIEKNVALEVQAEALFPKPAFLKLAKQMGAKFSFGSNNFTDRPHDLARWFEAVEWLNLTQADVWTLPKVKPHVK